MFVFVFIFLFSFCWSVLPFTEVLSEIRFEVTRKVELLKSGLWFTSDACRQGHADVTDEITAKGEVKMKMLELSAKDPKCCKITSKAVMHPSITALC